MADARPMDDRCRADDRPSTEQPEPGRGPPAGPGRAAGLAHALALPALLIALATLAHMTQIDQTLSDRFFDAAAGRFAMRADPLLELVGHQLAKSALLTVWCLLLAAAIASRWLVVLKPVRALLWATVGAMALGPAVVVLLKSLTTFPCPWSLQRYGGFAAEAASWFTVPAQAGHCFPAGHSAGGFSLFAVVFAARAVGCRRLARLALAASLGVGAALSAVRIVQGAHFLSHALWSAAIDWLAAGLVFGLVFGMAAGRPGANRHALSQPPVPTAPRPAAAPHRARRS
jgi:membrane-associated PAP2 superfamily phosphatase